MTVQHEIPVIDLADLEGPNRERIGREIATACEDWGFFQVVNHGIDPSLMKKAQQMYTEFFHLPIEEKMKIVVPADGIEGWKHPRFTETFETTKVISNSTTAEYVDSIFIPELPKHKKKWPTNPPEFQPTVVEFVHAAKALTEKLLAVMSDAIGLESDAFVKRFNVPRVSVRANFYPLKTDEDVKGAVQPFVVPHSDVSGLTLLLSDMVAGLEVKKDHSWVRVDPRPNGFVVNVGDLAEILSNGRFKSVEHRGLPHPTKERLSVAIFYMPDDDAVMKPVEKLLDDDHPPKFRAISFGDYFRAFLTKGTGGKAGLERIRIEA